MFQIKIFELPIPDPYKTQARDLSALCFKEFLEDHAHDKEDRFCSQNDWYKFVFAIEDEQVIAKVTTLKRTIKFDGTEILLGGLGGVCTHPDKRKQGIASALLSVSMDLLKDQKCDVAYLCTDINDPEKVRLYNKFGFVPLNKPHTYVGKSGTRYTDDDGMVAPVCSQSIFKEICSAKEPFDIGVGNW